MLEGVLEELRNEVRELRQNNLDLPIKTNTNEETDKSFGDAKMSGGWRIYLRKFGSQKMTPVHRKHTKVSF